MAAKRLINYPAHLGPGGSAVQEPLFAGDMQWYADYEARHLADGAEGPSSASSASWRTGIAGKCIPPARN